MTAGHQQARNARLVPLLFASALVFAKLLDTAFPLPIGVGDTTQLMAGWLLGLGTAVVTASATTLRRTVVRIGDEARAAALVSAGPYRLMRHPVLVGLSAVAIGCGLFMDTWWAVLMVVPLLTVR